VEEGTVKAIAVTEESDAASMQGAGPVDSSFKQLSMDNPGVDPGIDDRQREAVTRGIPIGDEHARHTGG